MPFKLSEYNELGYVALSEYLKNSSELKQIVYDYKRLALSTGLLGGMTLKNDLDEMILKLSKIDRSIVGKLYDLGTRPSKLNSINQLRCSPAIQKIVEKIYPDKVVGVPLASDTFHIYLNNPSEKKYLLPWHADWPHLLQSPDQFTIWIYLSETEKLGGLEIYPHTHRDQHNSVLNDNGLYEIMDLDLDSNETVKYRAVYGDTLIVHGNAAHRSIPELDSELPRLTLLFRFSNMENEVAIKNKWVSAQAVPEAMRYEEYKI